MTTEQERESSVVVLPSRSVQPGEAEAISANLHLLPEPALLFAIDGTILNANPAALQLLEATPDELIGTSVYSLGSMEPEKTRDATAHVARGTTIRFEMDFVTLEGSRRRVDIINLPVVTLTGKVESVIGFSRDITERSAAEREHALMAAVVESSGDAIMSAALDGTITSWNHRAEEMFGFAQAEAIGQPFLIIVPPQNRPLAMGMVQEIQANRRRVLSFEGLALNKDGAGVEMSMTLCGVYNRGQKLVGFSSIMRDNTERKRAERDHALLAAIVQSSGDAIISLSPEYEIMTWNEGAQRLFGYTAAEAIGRTNLDVYVPPEDRERVTGWMKEDLAAVRVNPAFVRRLEWRGRRKDGSSVDGSLVVSGIHDSNGNAVGLSLIMRDITERKIVERERGMLAAIVDSSEDAIVSAAFDSTIRTWNSGAGKLYGYTAEEVIGKPLAILLPPDRQDELETIYDKVLLGQTIRQYDTRRVRKDGTLIDVSISDSPVRDPTGAIVGVATIARDVIERNRGQRELMELATIVNTANDAIIGFSRDFRISSWNSGAERAFGIPSASAVGCGFDLFVPPELVPLVLNTEKHVLDAGQKMTIEVAWPKQDGDLRTWSVDFFPLFDAGGKIVAGGTIGRDISERKRAERELARYAAIVDASSDVILSGSREIKIESWNAAAERVYGYTAEEAIGRSIDVFIDPDEFAQALSTAQRVVETGQSSTFEQHTRRRDGSSFVCAFSVFPIRDAAGKVTGVGGVGRDTTELKRVEQELRDKEIDLVAAREAALAASRAKSEFLSSMSHEIRTPMNAILGMADLLAESPLNPEQKKYLEIMSQNGAALLDLINGILDLARIESGRLLLEEASFDLDSVVDGTMETLGVRAQQKGLELLEHIMPDVRTGLIGDRLRLGQILLNLVGNAIKFTERGQVLLTVECDRESDVPGYLHFSIADTGIGIAPDKVSQLFSDFTQLDSSTTRKYGGSGLGLAIVRRLLALMSGRVWVESELGRGSIFHFTMHSRFNPKHQSWEM